MNKEEALAIVKEQLTEKRYLHTVRVTETAVALAERYGVDREKAEMAAIFHDYAKFRPEQEMIEIIHKNKSIKNDLLDFASELWHAPVGAALVRDEVGIDDEEVLQAIHFHTTGRANMTALEKVIFLADYIEPGRSFKGVEQVRELARMNLDHAVFQSIANTIKYLIEKKALLYPDSIALYNDLVNRINKEVI